MSESKLQIRMLGDFSLCLDGREINDSDNRSKKVWLLLAYMIYHRNRSISQEELIDLLWGEEDSSSNPINALKTMFHRVRSMLNQLGPNMGHTLIVRQDGSYAWNTGIAFRYDVEEFESACKAAASKKFDEEICLRHALRAAELYRGDFLPKLSSEPWVVPVNAYFHSLYVQTVQAAIPILEQGGLLTEASALCRRAISVDPYDEGLYQHLMQELVEQGNQREAIQVYEGMSQLLFDNFGIMPSNETKAIYREAAKTVNDREINLMIAQEQLRESEITSGALLCEYDFFRILYQAEARAVARSGDAVHVGLLSVSAADGSPLPKRSLHHCMDNLQELIRDSLRRGDIASRCSVSQFIILLPQANYENSLMVMDRISKAFARQYPHSPAMLHYSVQPLEPNT